MTTWTDDDAQTLKRAIASGVLTVSYDGPPRRTVQYQNLREMRELLAEMLREVNGTTTYRRVQFRKGVRDAE